MLSRKMILPLIALLAVVFTAKFVWALGFELSETKEQLKLKYEVAAQDHGTGRVTIVFTLEDEGRIKPLDRGGIDLVIPSEDGSGYVDLSVSLDRQKEEGKQVMRVHLKKELAERASIQLKTHTIDGKQIPLTWYYHNIPLAKVVKQAEEKK